MHHMLSIMTGPKPEQLTWLARHCAFQTRPSASTADPSGSAARLASVANTRTLAVLALGWFSHGVMSAWSHPETALLAWVEIALSLLVIALASLPGLRARFGRKST